MKFFNKEKDHSKSLDKVNQLSEIVDKKIKSNPYHEVQLEELTFEELEDLNKVLQIAHYLLIKHESKKQIHSIMKEIVDIISNSSSSLSMLDDDIDEMSYSANSNLDVIKETQAKMYEKTGYGQKAQAPQTQGQKVSSINLTKFPTQVYTTEYLQNSTGVNER